MAIQFMRSRIIYAVLIFLFLSCNTTTKTDRLFESANILLENESLSAYHGWIKYLIFDVQEVADRPGVTEEQREEKINRLELLIKQLSEENPTLLQSMKGVQEWAYESRVDGSGQPFMITIPKDYDGTIAMPINLYMHGLGGNHFEHFTGNSNLTGAFELSVLGRARGGGYVGLSEADVLDALNYVEKNWNIDPDQIHLRGGSMGGYGTFRLGSRYPHRFASARPTCGFASSLPYGNLITLPIYAIHSDDDFVVPFQHALGPMNRLKDIGAEAILDITTGLGHASWDYSKGNARAKAWHFQQKRPVSTSIKHINFTAFDGEAKRSWWAEIEEWGSNPVPAKFVLILKEYNTLDAQLYNINQLKLYLDESSIELNKTLYVTINGLPQLELTSPLPSTIYLQKNGNEWKISNGTDLATIPRHTPGGANNLYNGEPLLIVYGTTGTEPENTAMLEAARIASRNSNASWDGNQGDYGMDSIQHNQNLFGNLNIKADKELTKKDIDRCHLVLIGTASQNSVVASIAEDLPLSFSKEEITFADGEIYAANDVGLGLVYYNPEAPDNLIFWVASHNEKLYKVGSPIPSQMTFSSGAYHSSPSGYDCLLINVENSELIAGRNFNSNWELTPHTKAIKTPSSIKSNEDFFNAFYTSVRKASETDFVFFMSPNTKESDSNTQPETIPLHDIASMYYYEPIGIFTFNGSEVLEMQTALQKNGQSMYPKPEMENINTKMTYTVALPQVMLWYFVRSTKISSHNYHLTDIQLRDAILQYFPRE